MARDRRHRVGRPVPPLLAPLFLLSVAVLVLGRVEAQGAPDGNIGGQTPSKGSATKREQGTPPGFPWLSSLWSREESGGVEQGVHGTPAANNKERGVASQWGIHGVPALSTRRQDAMKGTPILLLSVADLFLGRAEPQGVPEGDTRAQAPSKGPAPKEEKGTPPGFPWLPSLWSREESGSVEQGVSGTPLANQRDRGRAFQKGIQGVPDASTRGQEAMKGPPEGVQGTPRGFPWLPSLWSREESGGEEQGTRGTPVSNHRERRGASQGGGIQGVHAAGTRGQEAMEGSLEGEQGTPRGFPWLPSLWSTEESGSEERRAHGAPVADQRERGGASRGRGGQGVPAASTRGKEGMQGSLEGEQGTPRGSPWLTNLWPAEEGSGRLGGGGPQDQHVAGTPGDSHMGSERAARRGASSGEQGAPANGAPGEGFQGKGALRMRVSEEGTRGRKLMGAEAEPEEWLRAADVSLTSEQRMVMMLFLEQWFAFPGPQKCGNWARDYSQLHHKMRAGELPAKFITFSPDDEQGLGDRLLGMVSSFLAALVSNRALIINDPLLGVAFEPGHVDWTPRGDVSMNVTGTSLRDAGAPGSVVHLRFKNAQTRDNRNRVRFPRDLVEFRRRLGDSHNVLLETNGGILTTILGRKVGPTYELLNSLGLKVETAYPCILRFLLRPRPEVAALMRRTYHALHGAGGDGHPTICIHMRVPDVYTWDPVTGKPRPDVRPRTWVRNGLRQLFSCASKVAASYAPRQSARWLFMSESMALRDIAVRTYPRQVVLSDVRPLHPGLKNQTFEQRAAAMRSTAADWLLFSTCKYYVIVDSGFCKTSLAFSTTANGTFMFGRPNGWGFRGHCDPSEPADLSSLGQTWSGL